MFASAVVIAMLVLVENQSGFFQPAWLKKTLRELTFQPSRIKKPDRLRLIQKNLFISVEVFLLLTIQICDGRNKE